VLTNSTAYHKWKAIIIKRLAAPTTYRAIACLYFPLFVKELIRYGFYTRKNPYIFIFIFIVDLDLDFHAQSNDARLSHEPSSGPSMRVISDAVHVYFQINQDVFDVAALCVP
jgi:hypothetical protein